MKEHNAKTNEEQLFMQGTINQFLGSDFNGQCYLARRY